MKIVYFFRTRGTYGEGENTERFTYSLALVFSLCVANFVYATIMSKFIMDQGIDTTPSSYYAVCALTYLVAMVSSNKALVWVSYPTQVIGKSCKPIPVMVLGVLLGRKRYPILKYLFVFLIVAGVALFMYKDKKDATTTDMSIGIGELLQPTYISSVERPASFVTQATCGAGVKCGNALRKLTRKSFHLC